MHAGCELRPQRRRDAPVLVLGIAAGLAVFSYDLICRRHGEPHDRGKLLFFLMVFISAASWVWPLIENRRSRRSKTVRVKRVPPPTEFQNGPDELRYGR